MCDETRFEVITGGKSDRSDLANLVDRISQIETTAKRLEELILRTAALYRVRKCRIF